jgi:hypothetical protein
VDFVATGFATGKSLQNVLLSLYGIMRGNGLPFGRPFCNSLAGLALTILREKGRYARWRMVGNGFVGLTENKPIYEEVIFTAMRSETE